MSTSDKKTIWKWIREHGVWSAIAPFASIAVKNVGMVSDPVILVPVTIMLVAFPIFWAIACWTWKEPVESQIVSLSGERFERQIHVHSFRQRLFSSVLAVFAIGVAIHTFASVGDLRRLADVRSFERVGLESNAEVGNESMPFAYVSTSNDRDPAYWVNGAYVVRFELQKRSRLQWVRVYRIKVRVRNVKPVGKYAIYAAAKPEESALYLIEIDDPKRTGKDTFSATNFYLVNQEHVADARTFNSLLIEDDKPAIIDLRVNSRVPGRIKFDIVCEVGDGLQRQDILIRDNVEVLYIGDEQAE